MPEQIILTEHPLKDALNKVTGNFQFQYRFRAFTTNDKRYWNGHVSPSTLPPFFSSAPSFPSKPVPSQPAKTGVRIDVYHPKRGWEKFTIRDDYDFEHGQRPAGKGYHVNVEAPSEKIAYCSTRGLGESYVQQLWDHLSERASVDGEEKAAAWYMNGKNTLGRNY